MASTWEIWPSMALLSLSKRFSTDGRFSFMWIIHWINTTNTTLTSASH